MYELRYKPPAIKYLKKIKEKSLIALFKNALVEISTNPYTAGEAKKGDLAGIYCRDVHYNKTNYEIAYQILEVGEQLVVVIHIGTRENFYNEVKRYMNI